MLEDKLEAIHIKLKNLVKDNQSLREKIDELEEGLAICRS